MGHSMPSEELMLQSHSAPPHYAAPISLSSNIRIRASIAHHRTHSHSRAEIPAPLPYLLLYAHQALSPYAPIHTSRSWTSSIRHIIDAPSTSLMDTISMRLLGRL